MTNCIVPIVSELLFYRNSPENKTRQFVDNKWKHDKVLCPWLTTKLNIVRESLLKFQSEAYDIQGIHDLGTDILLRYASSDNPEDVHRRYVAFQIKSHDDLARRDYLKELRSRFTQAVGEYRDQLERYYILLCGDMGTYRSKVREINKTMAPHDRAVVVAPGYAHGFLNLNRSKIWSVVDLYFREQDEVLIAAKKLVSEFSPTHTAAAIAVIAEATFGESSVIDIDDVGASGFLDAVYRVVPDYNDFELAEEAHFSARQATGNEVVGSSSLSFYECDDLAIEELQDQKRPFEQRWIDDTAFLMDGLLRLDGFGTRVRVDLDYGRPLQALLTDAAVRYGYRDAVLCEYVFELLGTLDRFGLAMPATETGQPILI